MQKQGRPQIICHDENDENGIKYTVYQENNCFFEHKYSKIKGRKHRMFTYESFFIEIYALWDNTEQTIEKFRNFAKRKHELVGSLFTSRVFIHQLKFYPHHYEEALKEFKKEILCQSELKPVVIPMKSWIQSNLPSSPQIWYRIYVKLSPNRKFSQKKKKTISEMLCSSSRLFNNYFCPDFCNDLYSHYYFLLNMRKPRR